MSSNFQKDYLKNFNSNLLSKPEKVQKNIYCISGLGADRRVFEKLKFKGYQPVHLNWLAPHKREKLTDYAQRLAAEINDPEPILIGLSFGGIVAVEIANQMKIEKVILISSTKTTREIPWYFKIFRWLPVHLLIPFKSLLWAIYLPINCFFSLESEEEKKLLKAILIDTDAKFLRWAINRVVYWKNQTIPNNIYHLHGTSDRIFPFTFTEPDFTIEKGGHFMIMNRATEISQLIERIIINQNK